MHLQNGLSANSGENPVSCDKTPALLISAPDTSGAVDLPEKAPETSASVNPPGESDTDRPAVNFSKGRLLFEAPDEGGNEGVFFEQWSGGIKYIGLLFPRTQYQKHWLFVSGETRLALRFTATTRPKAIELIKAACALRGMECGK